jgi:sugar/nucleoside kinase (ribokinase family)
VTQAEPGRLVVVGGASLDTLHFASRTARSAGGAGLYTALAAHRAGARVLMIGPRPLPMPAELAPGAARLDWRGPEVPADRLPTFEIAHHPDGATEMIEATVRAEASLGPGDLPGDLTGDLVFLIAMAEPRQQLALLDELVARRCRVACGAYLCAVEKRPEVVRRILQTADLFFCNETEARSLFGSLDQAHTAPGKLLFITLGRRGARVVQGTLTTEVAGVEVSELDPTGAGDTFSGTTLAMIQRGAHPVEAARRGVAAAAEMVTRIGPQTLLEPPPAPAPAADPRARVDVQRIARLAPVVRGLDELQPFPFVGPLFPLPGHPDALDFFFAATLQQFGFWATEQGRYARPMIATLDDRPLKGSDFLWAAFRRWLTEAPEELAPRGQATLSRATLARRLRDDAGDAPLPALGDRRRLARAYGHDLEAMDITPAEIVERANHSPRPVATLLAELDHVGGYKEDPLRKKSALLALILRQRPEGFLRRVDGDIVPPIVDYHVQRSCLRTGIVRIEDDELRQRLVRRLVVDEADESAVRRASHAAMLRLVEESGREMSVVDWLFFSNRKRCPEMTEPDCPACPLDDTCARDTELFQPVSRTTFY